MGATNSKIEVDKALLLCRERRRFVRQALDGRCSLAAAHVSYIRALAETGSALSKFIDPEHPLESSMYSSTSATPEPLALTDKSASQLSTSSQSLSQHVESVEPFSPSPSPPSSSRFHANYMKSGRNYSTTIEEKPPTSVTVTVETYSDAPPKASPLPEGALNFDQPPLTPGTPPWDYFGIFHPIDRQFSFQDEKELNHGLDNADNINRLRKVEGVPELEEDLDKSSANEKSEYVESEDDFDQPSSEPLVRQFKNRTELPDFHTLNGSIETSSVKNSDQENNESHKKTKPAADTKEIGGTPDFTPLNSAATVSPLPINGNSEAVKRPLPENKVVDKDFALTIKEIEKLFLRASESGRQVPRMLEANKVNFRPLVPSGKERRSNGSTYFPACFVCCQEEDYNPEEPATDDVKQLTFHRSVSSLSSSSHNILGTTSRDDRGEFSHELFSSICMNSGSHASTLDRLYAWERKLYDEVKASEIVRQEYDMKCKQLREQESRGESPEKIDKIRAKVKDSYSRVRVAIERINSISKTIEKIRDEELQPQLEELVEGLSLMWSTMLDCHKQMCNIISMTCNDGGVKVSMQSESHRQAVIALESELNFLCSSFTKWMSAHKCYLSAIKEWLLKCVSLDSIQRAPTRQRSSKRRNMEFDPWNLGAPPIYVTCEEWLKGLENLPINTVKDAIKDLADETRNFMPRQEQKHGSTEISRALSRRFGRSGELTEMLRNKDPADWSLGFDSFWSRLESFLAGLKTFSEQSAKMYGDLRNAINEARDRYNNPGRRMQPAAGKFGRSPS